MRSNSIRYSECIKEIVPQLKSVIYCETIGDVFGPNSLCQKILPALKYLRASARYFFPLIPPTFYPPSTQKSAYSRPSSPSPCSFYWGSAFPTCLHLLLWFLFPTHCPTRILDVNSLHSLIPSTNHFQSYINIVTQLKFVNLVNLPKIACQFPLNWL